MDSRGDKESASVTFDRVMGKLRALEHEIGRMRIRYFCYGWVCGLSGAYIARLIG